MMPLRADAIFDVISTSLLMNVNRSCYFRTRRRKGMVLRQRGQGAERSRRIHRDQRFVQGRVFMFYQCYDILPFEIFPLCTLKASLTGTSFYFLQI